jgi:ribose 5-phosphate isomerase B
MGCHRYLRKYLVLLSLLSKTSVPLRDRTTITKTFLNIVLFMAKKIAIGGDHAGFSLKQPLVAWLTAQGYEVKDFGTHSADSADYADFAHPVSSAVESGEFDAGVLVCGSGQGVAITANKHQGIRAALVWDTPLAALARQHNDANIICLPARFIAQETAFECVNIFLNTEFEGGRHALRVGKIAC